MTRERNNGQDFSPVEELLNQFGLTPVSTELFAQAMVHSSYANEHHIASNERLEFLGDSVLSLIACDFLFHEFKTHHEGTLSKLKAVIVSAPYLAVFSKQLHLDRYIRLGQGERKSDGVNKQNILADLFEAFIGAFFLNFGFLKTKEFVLTLIRGVLPEIIAQFELYDAKTNLQEWVQAHGMKLEYRTVKEEGPPHYRLFTVEVRADQKIVGYGTGRSLKEAQSRAAIFGLKALKNEYHPMH